MFSKPKLYYLQKEINVADLLCQNLTIINTQASSQVVMKLTAATS